MLNISFKIFSRELLEKGEKMKKLKSIKLVGILAILAISLFTSINPARAAQAYIDISVEEAAQLLNTDQDITILDVRTLAEYESGHIAGAISIPLSELEGRIEELDRDGAIVVYCKGGVRSKDACKVFMNHRFENVYNMLGGINTWIDAGHKVVADSSSLSTIPECVQCYSSKSEAQDAVDCYVTPKDCFVWYDPINCPEKGKHWRPLSDCWWGCAHWVAHQLNRMIGVTCDKGYSMRIADVISGRTEFNIAEARVGDIWTNDGRTHSGIVRQVDCERVYVESCSSIYGCDGTGHKWYSSGRIYGPKREPKLIAEETDLGSYGPGEARWGRFYLKNVGDGKAKNIQAVSWGGTFITSVVPPATCILPGDRMKVDVGVWAPDAIGTYIDWVSITYEDPDGNTYTDTFELTVYLSIFVIPEFPVVGTLTPMIAGALAILLYRKKFVIFKQSK